MSGIYDEIYSLIRSLLTDDKLSQLRATLHSAMNEQDLGAVCSNRDKLAMVNFLKAGVAHGPIREFRTTIFCVHLCARVETDSTDSEVRKIEVHAEISDGPHSGEILLVTEGNKVQRPQPTSLT